LTAIRRYPLNAVCGRFQTQHTCFFCDRFAGLLLFCRASCWLTASGRALAAAAEVFSQILRWMSIFNIRNKNMRKTL
jgi:hypothetical protein